MNWSSTQRNWMGKGALCILILIGCAMGVTLSMRQSLPDWMQIQQTGGQPLLKWFALETAGLLALCGISGFFAVGQWIPCGALLLHGLLFGDAVLTQMQTVGAWRLLIWLLPYGIVSSLLLLLAARESLRFSGLFFRYAFQRQWEENMPHCRRLYGIRYVVLVGLFGLLILLCSGVVWLITLFG